MMDIQEVFKRFEQIGACSFSTVDENGAPVSRIAHLFAADDDGLYLRTMTVKPFYRQMKANGLLSICGDFAKTRMGKDENGLPTFEHGFTMRVTGKVRELSYAEVEEKAKDNPDFYVATYDIKKYPETVVFVMYEGHGELYDYDYEMVSRDHKLERERFAFGGDTFVEPGLVIGDECIGCGTCKDNCTFKAIEEGEPYRIHGNRCDECGTCYHVCPVHAITWR